MVGDREWEWRVPAALPPVRGVVAAFYLFFWAVLLALFAVGTFGISWQNLWSGADISYTWAPLGLDVRHDADGLPYRVATVGASPLRAGLRPGDLILDVGGVDTAQATADPARARELSNRLVKPEGAPVRLVVRSGSAPPRIVTLTHRMANGIDLYAPSGLTPRSMTWANVTLFALPPIVLFVGALVLFRRRREPLAAVLSLSLLALASIFGNQLAFWETLGINMLWLWMPASCIGLSGLYLLALTFPSGRFAPRWTSLLAVGFSIAVLLTNIVPAMIWVVLICVVLGIGLMAVRYWKESMDERRQWRWAMLGLAAGVIIALAGFACLSVYLTAHAGDLAAGLWSWIITPLVLSLAATSVVGGLVLSVLRYRLYDTQAVLSRSLAYGVLTILLVAVFAGSEKIVEIVGEEYFGERIGALAGGLGAAFAAITIGPLHHRVSHWAEHLLRPDLIHLRRDLPPLLLEIGETSGPKAVAKELLDHVMHGLHATRAALIDGRDILAAHGIDAAAVKVWRAEGIDETKYVDDRDPLFPVRLRLAHRADRWLLIGARPDGTLLGRDEHQLLDDLVGPIADALRLARQHHGADAQVVRRLGQLEHRIAAIEALGMR